MWGNMGSVSKAFKKATSFVTGGVSKIFGGSSSSSGGTQEVTVKSSSAASPTDISGNYSGSEESVEKGTSKKKKSGKRGLKVGENTSGGSTKGLNVV